MIFWLRRYTLNHAQPTPQNGNQRNVARRSSGRLISKPKRRFCLGTRSRGHGLCESFGSEKQRDVIDQGLDVSCAGVLVAQLGELGLEAGVGGDVDVGW